MLSPFHELKVSQDQEAGYLFLIHLTNDGGRVFADDAGGWMEKLLCELSITTEEQKPRRVSIKPTLFISTERPNDWSE